MDKLFGFAKSIFGGDDDEDNASSNPFAILFKLDRDGDGKITEDGQKYYLNLFI